MASVDESPLSAEEVRILWDFVHGNIMNQQIRERLIEHWGMCERHAWAYATVEIELWHAGAGARGGHQPFDVSILYSDMAQTMRGRLLHARQRNRIRAIKGSGSCVVCDDLAAPTLSGLAVTHAGLDLQSLRDEANTMDYIRNWIVETERVWAESVCPECAIDADFPLPASGNRCRAHWIVIGDLDDHGVADVGTHLGALDEHLKALIASMTQKGAPAMPADDASWIQTLAWFHSWRFPFRLLAGR